MKTFFTFAYLCVSTFSFGQLDMFWNNYSNYNPAMSGFEYKHHGVVTYSDYFRNNTDNDLMMNYNARLGSKHGVGINLHQRFNRYNVTNLLANYNYQFDLKDAGRLSAGIGGGFNRLYENENYFSPNRTAPPESFTYLQINAGVAHQWKGLVSGINVRSSTIYVEYFGPGYSVFRFPTLAAHTAYNFKLGPKFQLTPRVLATIESEHDFSVQTNLEATFFDRLSAGALFSLGDGKQLGFYTAYDLRDKFRIAYSYTSRLQENGHDYFERGRHQFTLGFLLK